MFKTRISLRVLLISLTLLSLPLFASAQASRTWVAAAGDDVNPCSRTSPCRTFAGAISKTNMGGEIDTIDAGGFGAVTITKSVTIDGTAGFGSTLASGVNGVIINITAASDTAKTVRLRRLSINGGGTGIDGIKIVAAGQVFVDEVLIDSFTQHGINLTATGTFLSVANSTIRNIKKFGFNLEPWGWKRG